MDTCFNVIDWTPRPLEFFRFRYVPLISELNGPRFSYVKTPHYALTDGVDENFYLVVWYHKGWRSNIPDICKKRPALPKVDTECSNNSRTYLPSKSIVSNVLPNGSTVLTSLNKMSPDENKKIMPLVIEKDWLCAIVFRNLPR